MEENPRYVGIDVSKAQVDVAVRPTGQRWAASYNETGVGELVSQIVDIGVQRQLLLPVPSIILAGSPPVPDPAAVPLQCGSWGRRIPG